MQATVGRSHVSEAHGRDVAVMGSGGVEARVVTLGRDEGVGLAPVAVDVTAVALEGVGEVLIDVVVHPLRAGDVLAVPVGALYAVHARSDRFVLLQVCSPGAVPREGDGSPGVGWWHPGRERRSVAAEAVRGRHRQLAPHIDYLGRLASQVDDLDGEALRSVLLAALNCTDDDLLPQLLESETALYPAVDRLLRAVGGGTRAMAVDHRMITKLRHELRDYVVGDIDDRAREGIRARLYGLHTLLRGHVTKEDELYLPLLDLLPQDEDEALRGGIGAPSSGYGSDESPGSSRSEPPARDRGDARQAYGRAPFVAWQLCEED